MPTNLGLYFLTDISWSDTNRSQSVSVEQVSTDTETRLV